VFDVVLIRLFRPHRLDAKGPFFPDANPAKGTRKIAEKGQVATANFQHRNAAFTPQRPVILWVSAA